MRAHAVVETRPRARPGRTADREEASVPRNKSGGVRSPNPPRRASGLPGAPRRPTRPSHPIRCAGLGHMPAPHVPAGSPRASTCARTPRGQRGGACSARRCHRHRHSDPPRLGRHDSGSVSGWPPDDTPGALGRQQGLHRVWCRRRHRTCCDGRPALPTPHCRTATTVGRPTPRTPAPPLTGAGGWPRAPMLVTGRSRVSLVARPATVPRAGRADGTPRQSAARQGSLVRGARGRNETQEETSRAASAG